jgi:hypothetical protein
MIEGAACDDLAAVWKTSDFSPIPAAACYGNEDFYRFPE